MENFTLPTQPIGELFFDTLYLAGAILLVWSLVNVIASWRLHRIWQQLIEQRTEIRRWKRFCELRDKQQRDWN